MLEFLDNSPYIDAIFIIVAGFMLIHFFSTDKEVKKIKKKNPLKKMIKLKKIVPKNAVTISDLEFWKK